MTIYEQFSLSPIDHSEHDTFDAREWVRRLHEYRSDLHVTVPAHHVLSNYVGEDDYKIVDYGGDFGSAYHALGEPKQNYHVIETTLIAEQGMKDYASDYLHFWVNADNCKEACTVHIQKADIVYCRTSLQYAQDWKETLSNLASLEPEAFIFALIALGDTNTVYCLQNWKTHKIPSVFPRKSEFINFMRDLGYKVKTEKKGFGHKISDELSSAPKTLRVGMERDIIFERV